MVTTDLSAPSFAMADSEHDDSSRSRADAEAPIGDLLGRTNSISQKSPSSLLPPEPTRALLGTQAQRAPKQGPSSVLPPEPRPAPLMDDEAPLQRGPSSLLPNASLSSYSKAAEETVAVSPSELLPPPFPKRSFLKTWLTIGVAAGVFVGALFAYRSGLLDFRAPPDPDAFLASAKLQLRNGEKEAALVALVSFLDLKPKDPEGLQLLATAQVELGHGESAEHNLRRLIEVDGDSPARSLMLGRSLIMQGKFERLIADAATWSHITGPEEVDLEIMRGRAHLGLGATELAHQHFERALKLRPEDWEALLGLAKIAESAKRLNEAEALLVRAQTAAEQRIEPLLARAEFARAQGHTAAAIAAYEMAIARSPEHIAAPVSLAMLHLESGRLDDAIKVIEELRRRNPKHPMLDYLLAAADYHRKEYDPAQKALTKLLSSTPGHMPSVLLMGLVDYRRGNYREAVSHASRVLERFPGSVGARRLLIAALEKQGQIQRAAELADQTIRFVNRDTDMLVMAGDLHLRLGNLDAANFYLEHAVKADPENAHARSWLAMARLNAGDAETALKHLDRALELAPGSTHTELVRVLALVNRKAHDEALKALHRLYEREPTNPGVHNLMASVHIGKGNVSAARTSLIEALRIAPGFHPAALSLAQLELREGNPQAARRALEALLEREPNNAQTLVSLAQLGPKLGARDDEILEWLHRARAADPTSITALLLEARLHLRARRLRNALVVTQKAQAINPDAPAVLEVTGEIHLASEAFREALEVFSKLALRRPDSVSVLNRLAVAQSYSGNLAAARLTLQKSLALKADSVEALLALAEVELKSDRATEALRLAQQARKHAPNLPAATLIEADAHAALKDMSKAMSAFELALKQSSRHPKVELKLITMLKKAGHDAEAEVRLADALKRNPGDRILRAHMAEQQQRNGRLQRAAAEYVRLHQEDPDNPYVLNNLAWVAYKLADPNARTYAQRAYELLPDSPNVLDTYGVILAATGEHKRGIALLERAVAKMPESRTLRFHLAQASHLAGDYWRARRQLELVVQTKGDFPEEAEARALLKKLEN